MADRADPPDQADWGESPLLRHLLTALLVVSSAVLLFWRLDGALLWRDEASTANWARLMVESGAWLPRVFDGSQLIVQAPDGHDFTSNFLPAMQGWLQFYLAAISFKLFGIGTVSARLPFAILGGASLFVLYRLGIVLFGPGIGSLMPPCLSLFSIHFLAAARQSRYYIVVVLAASLLLLEFCRYLREPHLAGRRVFYFRIGFCGLLLYFANYASFLATWAALVVFALLVRDRVLIRGFVLLSAVMALFLGIEFGLVHLEFTSGFLMTRSIFDWDFWLPILTRGMEDFWRTIPLAVLVPAGFYLYCRRVGAPAWVRRLTVGLCVFLALSPAVLSMGYNDTGKPNETAFWLGAFLCLAVAGFLFFFWSRLKEPGLWTQAGLLAVLIVVSSPVLTIAALKGLAHPRHYYQILPAAAVLGALLTAAVQRAGGRALASGVFLGLLIWPNLNFNSIGF